MIKKTIFAAAAALALAVGQAGAATITFEELTEGDLLANQYAGMGVIFSPNAFSGAGGPTGNWASNTDMTIVSVNGSDIGGLGDTALVSGNLLRSYAAWNQEDGDPSFLIAFSSSITSISVDFAGVNIAGDVHLIAYDGATPLADVTFDEVNNVNKGQFTLSFAAASITSVAITPGSFNDWVGVDNINFTAAAVPEVSTYAMMALGMGLIAFKRRKSA